MKLANHACRSGRPVRVSIPKPANSSGDSTLGMVAPQRQVVTGIVVNKHLSLPRKHVRALKAAVHRKHTEGVDAVRMSSKRPGDDDSIKVLDGHLSLLKMIYPARHASLLEEYRPIRDC